MIRDWLNRVVGRAPTHADFARLMERAVRRAGYAGPVAFEADQFRLAQGIGKYIYLANAYAEYLSVPRSERDAVIARYARLAVRAPGRDDPALDEVRALLVPVIRNRAGILEMHGEQKHDAGQGDAPLQCRPYGPDCVELLAIDFPEVTTTLLRGPPTSWPIDLDEALAIARANLRAGTVDAWTEVARGVFRGTWCDNYDSSRALIPDLLERLPVKGRAVFMIPSRDVLLVTGDHDDAGLRHMVELAHDTFQSGGRWISACLYRYDDARTPHPFLPGKAETRERQRDLERVLLADAYDAQQVALERRYALQQRDVFVASFIVRREGDAPNSRSYCTWTKDVPSTLPKTDDLVFSMASEADGWSHLVVEWDAALRVVSDLLEEDVDCYPPRFLTLGFPHAAVLDRLREQAAQR